MTTPLDKNWKSLIQKGINALQCTVKTLGLL